MKICPKCRFLDHEKNGPSYDCPMCGVIYSRIGDRAYEYKDKESKLRFEKIPIENLRPSWTWEEIKNGPKKRSWNFWLWVVLIIAAMLVTAINIQRSIGSESIIPELIPFKQENNDTINKKHKI